MAVTQSSSAEAKLFSFKVESATCYTRAGTWVCSPSYRICNCSFRLVVYPAGEYTQGDHLSAYIEALPDVLWTEKWSIPNVSIAIAMKNADESKSRIAKDLVDYSKAQCSYGFSFADDVSWPDLDSTGWLTTSGELQFDFFIDGDFNKVQDFKPDLSTWEMLWVERKFPDMCLATEEGQEFPCHRGILASSSQVFDRMLAHECQEQKTGRIVVGTASSEVVRALLVYIYTGHVQHGVDPFELANVAGMYELRQLLWQCAEALKDQIVEGTVVRTLRTLRLHSANCDQTKTIYEAAMNKVQSEEALLRSYAQQLPSDDRIRLLENVYELVVANRYFMSTVLVPAIGTIERQ